MKVLEVAIIGYGIVGQRRKNFIDKHPNLKTVAVCDVRFLEKSFLSVNQNMHNNYVVSFSYTNDHIYKPN